MDTLQDLASRIYHSLPRPLKEKIVHHGRFVRHQIERLRVGLEYPVGIDFEANSLCTRACGYCPRDPAIRDTLDDWAFYSVIDQLKEWGYKGRISPHSYNEPLTDKRIFDFLRYAHTQIPDANLVLFTNGDLLDDRVLQTLVECGVSEVILSIHEPRYNESTQRLMELHNISDIITIVDMREGHRTMPLSNRGGSVEVGPTVSIPNCYMVDAMVIRADGNVVLCCNDYWKQHIFGNVYTKRVRDIWENPDFVALRNDIRRGRYDLDLCKQCGYQQTWER